MPMMRVNVRYYLLVSIRQRLAHFYLYSQARKYLLYKLVILLYHRFMQGFIVRNDHLVQTN